MTITWESIISIAAGITAICVCVSWLYKGAKKVQDPVNKNEERITAIEARLAKHDEMLDADNRRLKAIEGENRIIMKALLALLSHGIDGNDVDGMRLARDELQKYLIER